MQNRISYLGKGKYIIKNLDNVNYLYFPLSNNNSFYCSISPNLTGDIKTSHNTYFNKPISAADLNDKFNSRNVYLRFDDRLWSISGNSPLQELYKDKIDVEYGFLYQKVYREDYKKQVIAEITNFVPKDMNCELMKIKFKNITGEAINFVPNVAIPIYGRSADNLRDHRHVTSLLNRATVVKNGIINKPTLSFDERGHNLNTNIYGVLVNDNFNNDVTNYIMSLNDFTQSGSLSNPVFNKSNLNIGDNLDGEEIIASLELPEICLKTNEEYSLVICMFIDEEYEKYNGILKINKFDELLMQTSKYWERESSFINSEMYDSSFSEWFKWVAIQPKLRRIFGNSFLPYHDYGRGGKGWRDLWQDLLTTNIYDYKSIRENLINNFKGVRIDGSNATIIGDKPGEFKADRNNIVRVWMDHGFWPFQTVYRYLHKSGDIDILFEKTTYFKDQHINYVKDKLPEVKFHFENKLLDVNKNLYKGSIIEHILIENLVPFYNVGKHNIIKIEDADWNDGLDMAKENGESVAFTAAYYLNLINIIEVLQKLLSKGIEKLSLFEEMLILISDEQHRLNDIEYKHNKLNDYFKKVRISINGRKQEIEISSLINNLEIKALNIKEIINNNEIEYLNDKAIYNGYYDNSKNKLSDINNELITLTGQTFPLMSKISNRDVRDKVVSTTLNILFDKNMGGYKLNSNFNEIKTNMGRMFGFAYGTKENGAMFTHMNLMYIYALYDNGYIVEGNNAIETLYNHVSNFDLSKTLPGLPEYVNTKGRGYYPFLTGSASWFVLTIVEQVYGVKGLFGDLRLQPKLIKKQFIDNSAKISLPINGKKVDIIYINNKNLEFNEYVVSKIYINEKLINFEKTNIGVIVPLHEINKESTIKVILDEK